MDKSQKLQDLKKRMQEDNSLPLRDQATQLVFGEGDPDSKIYFLGEAPGFHEDKQGRPFIGLAGKLLEETLNEMGLNRPEVYISNVVRFRPPENRDPTDDEIASFAPYVDEEIDIVSPQIICTLGRFSMGKFIPGVKISQVHGQPRNIDWKGKAITVIPMFHPAAALRAGDMMKKFKDDFQILTKILNQKVETPEEPPKKPEQLSLV